MVRAARALVIATLTVAAAVAAAEDRAAAARDASALVLRELDALRARDFPAAYALASDELRRHFSVTEFEWLLKRAHPEIVTASAALVVRTYEAEGYTYVLVVMRGGDGGDVEAVFEMVTEGGDWKINAVTTRRGAELL